MEPRCRPRPFARPCLPPPVPRASLNAFDPRPPSACPQRTTSAGGPSAAARWTPSKPSRSAPGRHARRATARARGWAGRQGSKPAWLAARPLVPAACRPPEPSTAATAAAVQACAGYPESGVCDANTWRKLLGEDAQPSDILRMRSGESDDDDLAAEVRQGEGCGRPEGLLLLPAAGAGLPGVGGLRRRRRAVFLCARCA